tara:strand:+ start:29 stop:709 length:681 start_codon:yes stop_codon:yes gene_type:complete
MNKVDDYIVSIWKEPDWTSNDIIRYIKPFISPSKVGHAGTLDPFAEGVLVVCIGKMTKQVSTIMEFKKEYDVEIKFGERTDTLDCTGNITKIKKYKYKNDSEIISALNSFLGEIKQIPPMFSALKHKGERLYNLARKGITIKREARKVFIDSIKLLKNNKNLIKIRVVCGKGTYVRSLARDIAYKLDTEGYVTELIRTKVGGFNKNNSINVKDFKDWLLYQQHSQN